MTMGIQPENIDNMSAYEMELYTRFIPLWQEYNQTSMENSIKKAISEMM